MAVDSAVQPWPTWQWRAHTGRTRQPHHMSTRYDACPWQPSPLAQVRWVVFVLMAATIAPPPAPSKRLDLPDTKLHTRTLWVLAVFATHTHPHLPSPFALWLSQRISIFSSWSQGPHPAIQCDVSFRKRRHARVPAPTSPLAMELARPRRSMSCGPRTIVFSPRSVQTGGAQCSQQNCKRGCQRVWQYCGVCLIHVLQQSVWWRQGGDKTTLGGATLSVRDTATTPQGARMHTTAATATTSAWMAAATWWCPALSAHCTAVEPRYLQRA